MIADGIRSPGFSVGGFRRWRRASGFRRRRVRLEYFQRDSNDEEADRLYEELKRLLNHLGMADHHVLGKNFYMHMSIPIAGVAHQAGTIRFGHDPATSVLDEFCKAHELDNLYVVDTSFFVSIGAVNPSLTAMANAIRVGEHLAERLK
jgi:choline dehydrogenase-like flavoprotein